MSEEVVEYKKRKPKPGSVQLAAELGKLPPQAVDLEEAVIGALMIESRALNIVSGFLPVHAFYKDAHQHLYSAIMTLVANRQPADILTVTQQCKRDGTLELVGGPYYISQLTNKISSAANIEFHARIIVEKFMARELIRVSTEAVRDAYEDSTDVLLLVDKFQSNASALGSLLHGKKEQSISSLLDGVSKSLDVPPPADGVIGVKTGFNKFDDITMGLQRGRLYINAARPGMGKTTFALQLAHNVAVSGVPVAFFSLEMPAADLVIKMVAMETGINQKKIQRRDLNSSERERINLAMSELRKSKLYIDDSSGTTPFELRSKCRTMMEAYGIGLIVVDYLQLMTPAQTGRNFQNRNDEVSFITSSLKNIAKDLNVPVLALSQLSRELEKRVNKEPMLSDLRDSGSIEQDADLVLFLYRPAYYGITANSNGDDISDLCKLIIAKHRHGELANIMQRFNGGLSKFSEYNGRN